MNINVKQGAAQSLDTDLLVVNLFESATTPVGATGALDEAMGGQISHLMQSGDIKGKLGEVTVLYGDDSLSPRRILIVGLGEREKFNLEKIVHAAGAAAKKVRDLGIARFATTVHGGGAGGVAPAGAAQALVEGTILALYDFRGQKTESDDSSTLVEELTIVESDAGKLAALEAGAKTGQVIAESVLLARDLVNQPANYATPTIIAEQMQEMAGELGLSCQVLEKEQMGELGMGALLGVNQGSDDLPKFIILEHRADSDLPTIVLVGKGITFDSGGISLKPGKDMHKMKGDMAGGAAVLGALRAAALLNIPLHVVGLVPATDNLPSGKAVKPGDVLGSMSGKTIEVQNTDAEGRLVLADALAYAGRYDPAAVIDIATLTGACVIALGMITTGLMSNSDDLSNRIVAAGTKAGERVWRLPLFEEYGEQLKSEVADLNNIGGRPAGAITAGVFLSRFAEDYAWAHLDIAGTAAVDNPSKPYLSAGATGVGVRLFVELLRSWTDN